MSVDSLNESSVLGSGTIGAVETEQAGEGLGGRYDGGHRTQKNQSGAGLQHMLYTASRRCPF
jgi:hypothetical protein